jgi:hypothetical protein
METHERKTFRFPPEDLGFAMRFWTALTPKDFARPEKELMLAVLTDAIWDYRRYAGSDHRRFKGARDWLFDDDDDQLFSFITICETLNFNPTAIRRALLTWSNDTAKLP